jgi:hypothetical protein
MSSSRLLRRVFRQYPTRSMRSLKLLNTSGTPDFHMGSHVLIDGLHDQPVDPLV